MVLYKYVNADRIDILKERKIRFTQYFNQNDPYECSLALMPLEIEMEQAEKDEYSAEKAQIEVQFKNKFHQFGMLCLTIDPKNLLMWSHYADNHKGFVIGFDTDNSFFKTDEKMYDFNYGLENHLDFQGFGTIKPIEYLQNRKSLKVGESTNLHDLFFTKSIHWKYEEEFRIIKNILDFEPIDENGQICLLPFPKECISEIIIGLNTKNSIVKEISSIINNELSPNLKLLKAKLNHLEFGIEFDQIKNTPNNK